MAITLPELPFKRDALAPHISERTIDFHHGKHHKSYVDKTNKMIEGTDLEGQDLESIIASTAKDVSKIGIFNNAAQAWNHAFYWNCLTPGGGGPPSGVAGEKINSDFGSYEAFVEQFNDAATTLFGSGWAWLAMKEGKLDIMKGPNADTPLVHGAKPLLAIDVWEHAYYLDYQNGRADYVSAFIDHLINWDFINSLLA